MGLMSLRMKERRRMELWSRVREGLKRVAVAEPSGPRYRRVKRMWKPYPAVSRPTAAADTAPPAGRGHF